MQASKQADKHANTVRQVSERDKHGPAKTASVNILMHRCPSCAHNHGSILLSSLLPYQDVLCSFVAQGFAPLKLVSSV